MLKQLVDQILDSGKLRAKCEPLRSGNRADQSDLDEDLERERGFESLKANHDEDALGGIGQLPLLILPEH